MWVGFLCMLFQTVFGISLQDFSEEKSYLNMSTQIEVSSEATEIQNPVERKLLLLVVVSRFFCPLGST